MLKVSLSSILLLLLITFNDSAKSVDSIPEKPAKIASNFTVNNPVIQPQKCYDSAGLVLKAYIIPDLGYYCLGPCEPGYCCKIAPAAQ